MDCGRKLEFPGKPTHAKLHTGRWELGVEAGPSHGEARGLITSPPHRPENFPFDLKVKKVQL